MLDAIYARVPAVACQQRCQRSCIPVQMLPHERARFTGRRSLAPVDGHCSLLAADGTCSEYAQRPLICRLFGVVDTMPCPEGCQPERWLTEPDALALMAEITAWSLAKCR